MAGELKVYPQKYKKGREIKFPSLHNH